MAEHESRMERFETQRAYFDRYTQLATSANGTSFMLNAIGHWMGIYDYPPSPPVPPALPPSPPPSFPSPPSYPPPPPSPSPPPVQIDFWLASQLAVGTATALVTGTAGPAVDLLTGHSGESRMDQADSDDYYGSEVYSYESSPVTPPPMPPIPPSTSIPAHGQVLAIGPSSILVFALLLTFPSVTAMLAWRMWRQRTRGRAVLLGSNGATTKSTIEDDGGVGIGKERDVQSGLHEML